MSSTQCITNHSRARRAWFSRGGQLTGRNGSGLSFKVLGFVEPLLRNVVSETGKLIDLRHGGAGVDGSSRERHAFEEIRRPSGGYQRRTGIDQHDIARRALLAGKNGASDIPVLRRV